MNIEANAASVLGRDHRAREVNRQDVAEIRRGELPQGGRFVAGAVSDGCGSAARSEVGAAILVSASVEETARRLAEGATAIEAVAMGFRRAARALHRVAAAVTSGDARLDFVERHLLATLLVVAHDGVDVAVGARGDGLVIFDDEIRVLERGGAPDYLAYALTGARVTPAPYFDVRPLRGVSRIAIATDGFDAALASEVFGRPGRSLQRWLNVQATRGPLLDDATVIVLERQEEVM